MNSTTRTRRARFAATREFLTEFLGWKPELLEFFRPSTRAQMFAGQANVIVYRPDVVSAATTREGEAPAEPSADAGSAGASPSQRH